MSGNSDITFVLEPSFESGRQLLVVHVSVGLDIGWDMLPNPLLAQTVIRASAARDYRARMEESSAGGPRVTLQDLRIDRQPIPDLSARIVRSIPRIPVDGILGLDFFQKFSEVRWDPHTHRVTLVAL